MRNLLISLLATLILATGAAMAQDIVLDEDGYWAGVSAGYPGASVHFGVENVVQSLAVRANVGYNYAGAGFSAGLDALYTLPVELDQPGSRLYAGGGLGFGFGDQFDAAVILLGGGEFRLVETDIPEVGIFGEVGPSVGFDGDFGFTGRLGANYHF